MSTRTVDVLVKRLRLPRALVRREPYLLASAVPHGRNSIDVRTAPFGSVSRAADLVFEPPFRLLTADCPEGGVSIALAVMESDDGYRAAGRRIDHALEVLKRNSVGSAVLAGARALGAGAATKAAGSVLGAAAKYLARNGDDVLGTIELTLSGAEVAPVWQKLETRFAVLEFAVVLSGYDVRALGDSLPPAEGERETGEPHELAPGDEVRAEVTFGSSDLAGGSGVLRASTFSIEEPDGSDAAAIEPESTPAADPVPAPIVEPEQTPAAPTDGSSRPRLSRRERREIRDSARGE